MEREPGIGPMRAWMLPVLVMSAMVHTASAAQVPDWNEVLKQATGYLQQYLRIDTTNPPGDVRQAVSFLTGILRTAQIDHEIFVADEASGKLNVLARLKGSGKAKPILMINHMDVVPAESDQWQVDPFGGVMQDGFIWGRGTLDMKAMGIAELITLILLKQHKVPLTRDVLWLAVCDEEVGGTMGAKWMVEHHYDLMNPAFVLDEGGGGSRGLLSPDTRIIFAPSVSEKQVLWVKLIAHGAGGHGSMPHGQNAVEILQQALGRLLAARASLEDAGDHPIVALMRERLGILAANRYTNAITRNTVTLTSFQAGVGNPPKVNVIPSEASATLDCRLLPGVSPSEFLAKIRTALADERVSVAILHQPPEATVSSGHDTLFFRAIEQVVKEFYPDAVVIPQLLPGGTDSRFFRSRGAIAYGFEPLVLTPEDLDRIHGHNERITIEQFHQMIKVLYEVIHRVAQVGG